jgi:hypothetical protein
LIEDRREALAGLCFILCRGIALLWFLRLLH